MVKLRRQLGSRRARILLCLVLTPIPASLAQPVVWVGDDHTFEDVDAPWGLPRSLLDRLAQRAAEYESVAATAECRETTHRVKYPGSGKTAEGSPRESVYFFTLEDGSMLPVQRSGKSLARSGKSAVPAAFAWTQLFAPGNQPYFAYRDLGEVPHAFGAARKIQFRGAIPYSGGSDIRQWEGTLLVDASSLMPLELHAQPLHLWPRLEQQRHIYLESFKISFFGLVIRFKKKPVAERVHVRFDMQENGMTLPADSRVEKLLKTGADQAIVRSHTVATYEHRFAAEPESGGP